MPAVGWTGQVGVRVVGRGVGVVHVQGPAWARQAGERHALRSVKIPLPHLEGGPTRSVLVVPVDNKKTHKEPRFPGRPSLCAAWPGRGDQAASVRGLPVERAAQLLGVYGSRRYQADLMA